MTVIGAIVLLASLALWAGLAGNLLTLASSDPAGRALAEASGFFLASALWTLLGILLLIAGVRGQMPSNAKVAAMLRSPNGSPSPWRGILSEIARFREFAAPPDARPTPRR